MIYVEAFARTYYNSMDTRKANYQYPSEEYLGNISMDKSPLMLFYKKSDPSGHGHLSMEMKSLILKLKPQKSSWVSCEDTHWRLFR